MKTTNNLEMWNVSAEEFPVDAGADQKLLFMLNYAVLAPSSHNTQPWLFRLQGHEVDLIADLNRSLPITDPQNRELIMSCGAALQHLSLAARYFGYSSEIQYFPEESYPDLLARFSLGSPTETRTEDILHFNAIQKRRTNRLPFDPDPIPESLISVLVKTAELEGAWLHLFTDDQSRYDVADLVARADRLQWKSKRFRRELAAWLTPNSSPRLDGIPGYAEGLGDLLSQAGPHLVRTFDMGEGQAARDRNIALYSPALAVLGTYADTRFAWLQAGQALSAVSLRARVEDVWVSYLNQAVEVPDTRSSLAALTGRSGVPQILLRLGFGKEVKPTPRRPLRQMMLAPRSRPIRIQENSVCLI